ncbi:granzyme B-like isoform X2 [Prionailurus viverrinus]|uniref:granzyme B-like isoform X2 n=1 Tax=Prionailurus viverrinus TaxID=61388 RepID=UPI001FF0E853|nr:granzyme B-like isoform X2 [Prionailurus viverrinus]
MQPLLLLLTFLLASKAEVGKIIGGHEANPHSRPYMAFLRIYKPDKTWKQCGGFLVREDFVLTAAHCWGSLMTVTLGAHNIKKKERTQQSIPVRDIIRPSGYTSETFLNDIMLLQGDSGGPLVCNNVAQGIVSCVKHCGTPPLVYTRISGFMHWIEKIMRHFSPLGPDSDASRISATTFSGAEARTALGKGGGEEAARDLINFHL